MSKFGRLKRSLVAGLGCLGLLMAGACGSSDSGEGGTTKLTVGLIPIIDVAPVYLGIQEGFFEEEGIEVEPVLASGGAAIVPAVMGGNYQIGFSNNVSLMIGVSKGLELNAISPGVTLPSKEEDDAYCSVLAPENGSVKNVEDLEGAKVAVNTLENIGDVTIKAAAESKGIDPDEIEFVEMPFPDMPSAFSSGQVDAVWECEPFVTVLSQDENADNILDNYAKVDPELSVASYFASGSWADEHKEELDGFLKALDKSKEYANEHPEEVRNAIADYAGIDEDLADNVVLPEFPSEFNEDSLETLLSLSEKYGLLGESINLDDILNR